MTALREYKRLETLGLWRERGDQQRREVILSLGDATLVIAAPNGEALSHWSLPAVERRNGTRLPALYGPSSDADEELELSDPEMIAAIERIRKAVARTRPRPGRLRLALSVGIAVAVLVLAVFWLPGALIRQTVTLLPEPKRIEIGQAMLAQIVTLSGGPCGGASGRVALTRLALRTFGSEAPPDLVVVPDVIPSSIALPGNIIVLSGSLPEDSETPDVLAGFLLAQSVRRGQHDPVHVLLTEAGLGATLRLLTTGEIAPQVLHDHAARLLSRPAEDVPDAPLLAAFARARISSEPYAYALDVSGESVLGLIEADPMRGRVTDPVLLPEDWLDLQMICDS